MLFCVNIALRPGHKWKYKNVFASPRVQDPQVLTALFSLLRLLDSRVFDSGVMVIELQSHKGGEMVASALEWYPRDQLPPSLVRAYPPEAPSA